MAEVEIPLELITEILTRLPVKPLTRFKCVSKTWNSLISSPSFINHHLQSNPNTNIVLTSPKFPQSLFSALIHDNLNHNNKSNLHFSQINHPFKTHAFVFIVASCNGILLISDSTKNTMFLYNLANNTYRLLPPIPSRPMEFWGFGYDSLTDDYKVIKVFWDPGVCMDGCVYSKRDNVWKFIKDESVSLQQYSLYGNAIGANGVLYFSPSGLKPGLMCFDLRTEALYILDYPELECSDFNTVWLSLRELGGCLCLLVNYMCDGDQLLYADVWEMREASWVKLFRILKSDVEGKPCRYLSLVAYSKDKRKLLLSVDSAWFGWYDLVTNKIMEVNSKGLPGVDFPRVAMTYVESLISVCNDKTVTS